MKKALLKLRSHFFNGLLLLFPAFITVTLAYRVFLFIYSLMSFGVAFIPAEYRHIPYIDHIITLTTIAVIILIILFVGLIVQTYVGKYLRRHLHNIIKALPVAGPVFQGLRQVMDIAFNGSLTSFSRVVLIEFPHKGSKSLGFITGEASASLSSRSFGEKEEICKVFVPGTPNPASGFLLIVPRKDIILTDLTVEEGLLSVVSGGILKQTGKAAGN